MGRIGMSTLAEVKLWGRTIGAVALEEGSSYAVFEYDPAFTQSGIEVAPLVMPLSRTVYQFPQLPLTTFHGLPGMLADSLPDRFGNMLIDAWLAKQGRDPSSFNAVERLCYTGTRGMGALEFYPVAEFGKFSSERLEIEKLVTLASQVLQQRDKLVLAFDDHDPEDSLKQILQVGTSAGGARAKAVIAWNPQTSEVRSGQVDAGSGFEYWLLKFDGVQGNRDKELADPAGYGKIEYAYYLMARQAGIVMSECRLLKEHGRSHFMTRRFDRDSGGGKLHMQSLGALAHFDYNMAGAYSYEQAFSVIQRLGLPMASVEQFFRRMVFNIVARNQDDHVKNIAFLMDKRGTWSLAPAFDVTYSYQKEGRWTGSHQMSMNAKRDNFVPEDFIECGKSVNLVRGRAIAIVREVCEVVRQWEGFAEEAGVNKHQSQAIQKTFRFFN